MAKSTSQAAEAVQMYTPRAASYDSTFHTNLASAYTTFIDVSPGERLLDLACGTGLVAQAFAPLLGPSGHVTGVDITLAMLDIARTKHMPADCAPCEWIVGDIAALHTVHTETNEERLQRESYDVITCCSALPLFRDPEGVIRGWAEYLKPGGRLVVDFPAEYSAAGALVLEEVLVEMGLELPYYRSWVKSEKSLAEVATRAGLEVEKAFVAKGFDSQGVNRITDLERIWKKWMGSLPQLEEKLGGHVEEVKGRWEKKLRDLARDDGVIKEEEGFYIIVARKGG